MNAYFVLGRLEDFKCFGVQRKDTPRGIWPMDGDKEKEKVVGS